MLGGSRQGDGDLWVRLEGNMIFSKCTRRRLGCATGESEGSTLRVRDEGAHVLSNVHRLEARLGSITGKDGRRLGFVYRDHTIAFPQADTLATTAQLAAIRSKAFKDRNRPIAAGRHWIHHQTKKDPEFVRIATYCGTHLRALGDEEAWPWTAGFAFLEASSSAEVVIRLTTATTAH